MSSSPQQPEEAQEAEPRKGGEERRRQDDNGHVERVRAQPPPAVRDDGEHHDGLREEHQPCRPVQDDADRVPRLPEARLLDHDDRDNEERRGDDRQL